MDDSDDTLSITSTVDSEPRSEYGVDGILAERIKQGSPEYLVQWSGYPLHRCSWEPAQNFDDRETLDDWEHEKKLCAQGEKAAFDLEGFQRECDRREVEMQKRKAKRRAKRRRLGIVDDGTSGIREHERMVERSKNDRPKVSAIPRRNSSSTTSYQGTMQETFDKSNVSLPKTSALSNKKQAMQDEPGSTTAVPRAFGGIRKGGLATKTSIKSAPSSSTTNRPQLQGAAILQNWDKKPTRKKWGLGDSWEKSAGGKDAHRFKNLAMLNRFHGYARNEPAPNVDRLTFVNLKDGKEVEKRPMSTGAIDKSPFQLIQEKLAKEAAEQAQQDGSKEVIEETLFVGAGPIMQSPIMQSPAEAETPPAGINSDDTEMPDSAALDTDLFGEALSTNPKDTNPWAIDDGDFNSREGTTSSHKRVDTATSTHEQNALHVDKAASKHDLSEIKSNRVDGRERTAPVHEMARPQSDTWRCFAYSLHRVKGDYGLRVPHHDNSQVEDTSVVYGDMQHGDIYTTVMFKGLNRPVKTLFLRNQKARREFVVTLTHLINASTYQEHYGGGEIYHGAGHIVPQRGHEGSFRSISDDLRAKDCGAMFFADQFSVLVYPAGMKSWISFDSAYPDRSPSNTSLLRFFIRLPTEPTTLAAIAQPAASRDSDFRRPSIRPSSPPPPHPSPPPPELVPHPPPPPDLPHPGRSQSFSHHPARLVSRSTVSLPSPAPSGESDMAESSEAMVSSDRAGALKLFSDRFQIDYKTLLSGTNEKDGDQPVNVFLHFPDSRKEDHKYMVSFLNKVNAKYYSSLQRGEWEHFVKHIPAGVVLIHASCGDVQKIPMLALVLLKGTINIWRMNFQPSDTPSLTRLFPLGATILLPDSVILSNPNAVRRCLYWFRQCQLPTKAPQSWKFATRPRLREWILNLVKANKQSGTLSASFRALWEELSKTVPLVQMDPAEDFETPLDEAPYASSSFIPGYDLSVGTAEKGIDEAALKANDNLLVSWYGRWTMDRVLKFRKSFIMYDGAPDNGKRWGNDWRHIHIDQADKLLKMWQVHDFEVRMARRKKRDEEKRKLEGS